MRGLLAEGCSALELPSWQRSPLRLFYTSPLSGQSWLGQGEGGGTLAEPPRKCGSKAKSLRLSPVAALAIRPLIFADLGMVTMAPAVQNDPTDIPLLLARAAEGYDVDVVSG